MKIVLIEAGLPNDGLPWRTWTAKDGRFTSPSVGLVSIASLCRTEDEVCIFDEKVDGAGEQIDADVAGISFKTMNAYRAYELADKLRQRGTRVILGGLHASLCPQEAKQHADVVVVGEAEPVWRTVLDELEKGNAKPFYISPMPGPPIDKLPEQRVEVLNHARYLCHSVQTARGCSLTCEFCPTRAMFGAGFRLRNPQMVIKEIERLIEIQEKPVFFTDDVFGAGEIEYIKKLTQEIKSLGIAYAVICDLKMVNGELLKALATSGCRLMCFDIFHGGSPEEVQAVRSIQNAGIPILAYFMFGFEHHGPDIFERVVNFVKQYDIQFTSFVLLAPYAGTPMFERLEKAGRILTHDWRLYDQAHVVFRPAKMTPEQLEEGFALVCRELGERYNIERAIRMVVDHK